MYILRRSHVNSLPEKRRTNTDVFPQARIDTKTWDGSLALKIVGSVGATPRSYVPVYRNRVRVREFGRVWTWRVLGHFFRHTNQDKFRPQLDHQLDKFSADELARHTNAEPKHSVLSKFLRKTPSC